MQGQERHERRAKEKKLKTLLRMLSFSAVGALGFLLIALFVFFLGGEDKNDTQIEPASEEIQLRQIEGIEQADIAGVRGNYASGYIRRTVEGDAFRAGSVVELPSQDDGSYYYEAWFVLPGVTDYFSVGAFEKRADGLYGLRFESEVQNLPADYAEYSKVIITREPRNGDEFPSPAHIAEAYF